MPRGAGVGIAKGQKPTLGSERWFRQFAFVPQMTHQGLSSTQAVSIALGRAELRRILDSSDDDRAIGRGTTTDACPNPGEAVMNRHLCVFARETWWYVSSSSLTNTGPEFSQEKAVFGQRSSYLASRIAGFSADSLSAPEHRHREISQMAAHGSFASSGPASGTSPGRRHDEKPSGCRRCPQPFSYETI